MATVGPVARLGVRMLLAAANRALSLRPALGVVAAPLPEFVGSAMKLAVVALWIGVAIEAWVSVAELIPSVAVEDVARLVRIAVTPAETFVAQAVLDGISAATSAVRQARVA